MATSYTISSDRKTITITSSVAIPGVSTDDHCLHINIEEGKGTVACRFITPDVVGVIRAYMATLVDASNNALYPNIEALEFASLQQLFVGNLSHQWPSSLTPLVANQTAANTAITTQVNSIVAAQVLL